MYEMLTTTIVITENKQKTHIAQAIQTKFDSLVCMDADVCMCVYTCVFLYMRTN